MLVWVRSEVLPGSKTLNKTIKTKYIDLKPGERLLHPSAVKLFMKVHGKLMQQRAGEGCSGEYSLSLMLLLSLRLLQLSVDRN